MPIWFELMVLLLATYIIGLGIGWMMWGRDLTYTPPAIEEEEQE